MKSANNKKKLYCAQRRRSQIKPERNHAVQIVYTVQFYDVILNQRGNMQYKLCKVQ